MQQITNYLKFYQKILLGIFKNFHATYNDKLFLLCWCYAHKLMTFLASSFKLVIALLEHFSNRYKELSSIFSLADYAFYYAGIFDTGLQYKMSQFH